MVKNIPNTIIVILLFCLVSCNLPGFTHPKKEDTVATAVAQLLTAESIAKTTAAPGKMTPESKIPTQPGAQGKSTVIPVPPTWTPFPTFPPPATVTPTPTLGGLPDSLGPATWIDRLDTGKAFGLEGSPFADENIEIKVEGGALIFTARAANGWHSWRLAGKRPQNFYLKADFQIGPCNGSDTYGLVFRAPDYGSGKGYYYGFSCDGKYSFGKWTANSIESIIPPTESEKINPGPNQRNEAGILASGELIQLFVNRNQLTEVRDTSLLDGGYIGAFMAPYKTVGFSFRMEEISYWQLP